MSRRPCVITAVSLALGMASWYYKKWYLFVLICLLISNLFYQYRRKQLAGYMIFICAAIFFFGILRIQQDVSYREKYEKICKDGQKAQVQGQIYKKEVKNGRGILYLKHVQMRVEKQNYSCNHILVYLDTEPYSFGEILCIEGKIKNWNTAANEGNYDERQYYLSQKIDFRLEAENVLGVYGRKNRIAQRLYTIRLKVAYVYENCMDSTDAGIAKAMLLGDKTQLDESVKKLYKNAGIIHILAISGLHISMLGSCLYEWMRKHKCSYYFAGVIACACMIFYGQMTGFGISAKRAVFMFVILSYAKCRGRSNDLLSTLSLAVIAFLTDNPFLILNAGFLLSVTAVAAVALVQELSVDEENKKRKAWYLMFMDNMKVSGMIQLVTFPVMSCFYYEVAVLGLIANLIVLPFASVLFMLLFVGGVFGIFSKALAVIVLMPAHIILSGYEKICLFTTGIPGSMLITGKMSWIKITVWYLALVIGCFAWNSRGRKTVVIRGICAAVLMGILFCPQKVSNSIDFLNVGQGDGIFIATEDGKHLFIDGGSTDINEVGIYRILPFLKEKGVRKIDYWFLSHADEDHINGFIQIARTGYPISNLVISDCMPEDAEYKELMKIAEREQIAVLRMAQGSVLGSRFWKMKCLFPDQHYTNMDRNARSLVLLYGTASGKVLFTGDISEAEEERMLKQKMVRKVDILKASHHGSKYSNSHEFLSVLSPKYSVISCGRYNRYGHPGKEAVERMKETSSEIFYTMYQGQIHVDMKTMEFTCPVQVMEGWNACKPN